MASGVRRDKAALSHRLLFGPGREDTGGANRPDTINLA
jgi:hypothetical protein